MPQRLRGSKLYGRISFMLDEKTYKKLRRLQARTIMKTKQHCSFSKIVGKVLEKGAKKYGRKISSR